MFKNAYLFRLDAPFPLGTVELDERLRSQRARPCGPVEMSHLGWSDPLDEEKDAWFAHEIAGCILICATLHQRVLPAAAIMNALNERVRGIQDQEGRQVGRAERKRLREQLMTDMLPKSFQQTRRIRAYIDRQSDWLIVDSGSTSQAEDVATLLRETLGSLPARPPFPGVDPAAVMTGWIAQAPPSDFYLGRGCELRDDDEVVRLSGLDLSSDEVLSHIGAGKKASVLDLFWDDRLSFTLTEDLVIKRLRVNEAIRDDAELGDDPASQLEADFALLALQMRLLLKRLETLFKLIDVDEQTQRAAA
ncbi:recombination-associated protein RdgC [Thiorhodococcus fuscus]|uniref:Recombination-associated protein RdgC n=1 Tax=Thiorhodococcus fuscus TaxID=527200 RepID=A0ABW4YAE5_9GAMM